MLIYQGRKTVS